MKPTALITVLLDLMGAETVIARSEVTTAERSGYFSPSSCRVLIMLNSPVRTASVIGIGFQSGIRR